MGTKYCVVARIDGECAWLERRRAKRAEEGGRRFGERFRRLTGECDDEE